MDGQAGIVTDNSYMQINQSTNSALINWQTFNIGSSEHVHFNQPGVNSLTINRINPANGASGIYGTLTATGQIFLLNPAGVIFGNGATVDVAGILASTSDINLDAYYQGRYEFVPNYDYNGTIINNGNISIKDSGYAAFVAPTVINNGVISANLGHVQLSSGDAFTVDLYGDQLINFKLPADKAAQLNRKYKVENNGQIYADGGRILMTSADVDDVVSSVINMNGLAQANSVQEKNGQIIFSAGKNGKLNFASNSKVKASKGSVHARAKEITLAKNSEINVSSDTDIGNGGVVTIGGNYQGLRFSESDYNAISLTFEDGATIKADANKEGHGGGVILWSDGITAVGGTITALGGTESGNGGFIETSGKYQLNLLPTVSVNAGSQNLLGQNGEWLLDPTDLYIDNAAAIAIKTALDNNNNVRITTQQDVVAALPGSSYGEIGFDGNDPNATVEVFETTVAIYNCNGAPGAECYSNVHSSLISTGFHGTTTSFTSSPGPSIDPDATVLFGNVYFNNDLDSVEWSSNASFEVNAGDSIYFNVANAIISNGTGGIKLYAGLNPEVHYDAASSIDHGLIYMDKSISDNNMYAVQSTNGGLVEAYIRPHDNFGQPSEYILTNGVTKKIGDSGGAPFYDNDYQIIIADLTTRATDIYSIDPTSQFIEYHWVNYGETQHAGAEARTLSNAATIVAGLNGTNSFDPTIGFALFDNFDLSVVDAGFTGFDEYRGHFDGLSHTLSNLDLTGASSLEGHAGFFYTTNGNQTGGDLQIIKNLGISNFDIEYTADSADRDAVYGGGALIGQAMLSADNPLYISNITINGSSVVALPYNNGGLDYAFRSAAGLLIGRTDGIGDLLVNGVTTGASASNFVDSFYIGSHVIGETDTNYIELSNIHVKGLDSLVDLSVMIDDVNGVTPEDNYENNISENSYLGGIVGRTTNPSLSIDLSSITLSDIITDATENLNFEIRNTMPNQDTFGGGIFGELVASVLDANIGVTIQNLSLQNIMQDTGSFVDYGNKGLYLGGFAGRIIRDNDLTDANTLDVTLGTFNFDRSYIYAQQQSNDFDILVADNNIGGLAGSIVADTFSINGFSVLAHINLNVEGFELGDGFSSNASLGIGSLVANDVFLNNGAFLNHDFSYFSKTVNSDFFRGLSHEFLDNTVTDNNAVINMASGGLIANLVANSFNVATGWVTIETIAFNNFITDYLLDPSSLNIYASNMIAKADVNVFDFQTHIRVIDNTSELIVTQDTTSNDIISTGGSENIYVGKFFGWLSSDEVDFVSISLSGTNASLTVIDNNEYTIPETKNYYLGGIIGYGDITNSLNFSSYVEVRDNSDFRINVESTTDANTLVNYNSYLSSMFAALSDNGSGNLQVNFNGNVFGDVDVYNVIGNGIFNTPFDYGYNNDLAGFDFASFNSYTGIIFGQVEASDIYISAYDSVNSDGGGPGFTVATTLFDVEFSDNTADVNIFNGGLAGQVIANTFDIGSILQSEVTRVVIATDNIINPNSLSIYNGGIIGQAIVGDLSFNDTISFDPGIGNDINLIFNNTDSLAGLTVNNNFLGGIVGNFVGDNIYFETGNFTQIDFDPYYNLFYSEDYSNYENKTRNVYSGGIIGSAEFTDTILFNNDVVLYDYYTSLYSYSEAAGILTENYYQGGLIGATNSGSNNLVFNGNSIEMYVLPYYDFASFNGLSDIVNIYTENSDLNVYLGGLIGQNNADNTEVYSNIYIDTDYDNAYSYIENWESNTNLYFGGLVGQNNSSSTIFDSSIELNTIGIQNNNRYSIIYSDNDGNPKEINTYVGGFFGDITGGDISFNDYIYLWDYIENYIENFNTDTVISNFNYYTASFAGRANITGTFEFNGDLDLSDTGIDYNNSFIQLANVDTLNFYIGQVFGYEDAETVNYNGNIYTQYSYYEPYAIEVEQANIYVGSIAGLSQSSNINFDLAANGIDINLGGFGSAAGASNGFDTTGFNNVSYHHGGMYGAIDNPDTVLTANTGIYVDDWVDAYYWHDNKDDVVFDSGTLEFYVGGLIGYANLDSATFYSINISNRVYLDFYDAPRVYADALNNTNDFYVGGVFGYTSQTTNQIIFNNLLEINFNKGSSIVNINTENANINSYLGGVFGQANHANTEYNNDITIANSNAGELWTDIVNNGSGSVASYVGGIAGASYGSSVTFDNLVNIITDFGNYHGNYVASDDSNVELYIGSLYGLLDTNNSNFAINSDFSLDNSVYAGILNYDFNTVNTVNNYKIAAGGIIGEFNGDSLQFAGFDLGGSSVTDGFYDEFQYNQPSMVSLYFSNLIGKANVSSSVIFDGIVLSDYAYLNPAIRSIFDNTTDTLINSEFYVGGLFGQLLGSPDVTFNSFVELGLDIDVYGGDGVISAGHNSYVGGMFGYAELNDLIFADYVDLGFNGDNAIYQDANFIKTTDNPDNINIFTGGMAGSIIANSIDFQDDLYLDYEQINSDVQGINDGPVNTAEFNVYAAGLYGQADINNSLVFNSLVYLYTNLDIDQETLSSDLVTTEGVENFYIGGLIGDLTASEVQFNFIDILDADNVNIVLDVSDEAEYDTFETKNIYLGGLFGRTVSADLINFNQDLDLVFGEVSLQLSALGNTVINSYVGGLFGLTNAATINFDGVASINTDSGVFTEIYDENNSANLDINTFVGGIAGDINGNNLVFMNDVTINNGVGNYIENNNTDTSYNNINLYVGNIAGRINLTNDLTFNGILDLSNTGYDDYNGSITISTFENLNYYAGQAFGYEHVTNVMFNSDIYNRYSYLYSNITTTGEQANVYYGGITGLTMSDNITFANGASLILGGVGGDVDETSSNLFGVNYINFNLGGMYGATDNPDQVITVNSSIEVNNIVEAYVYGNTGISVNNGGFHYNVGGLIGKLNSDRIDLNNVDFNAELYLYSNGTRNYTDPVNNTNELYLGGLFGQANSNVNNINFNGPVNINIANPGTPVLDFSTVNANLDVYSGGVFGYNNSVNTIFNDDVTISDLNTDRFATNVLINFSGAVDVYTGGISGADNVTSLIFNRPVDIQVDIASSVNSDFNASSDIDVSVYTGGISGYTTASDVLFDNDVTVPSVTSSTNLTNEGTPINSDIYTGGLFGVSNITSSMSQHLDNGTITVGNLGGGSVIMSDNFGGGLYTGGLFGLLSGASGITYITSDININADISSYQGNNLSVANVADKFTTGIYSGGLIGLQNAGLSVIYNNVVVNGNVNATSSGISGEAVQAAGGIYGGLVNSSFFYDNTTFNFINNGTTSSTDDLFGAVIGYEGGVIGYIDVDELNPTVAAGVVNGELLYDSPNDGADWDSGAGLFAYSNTDPCQGPSSDLCNSKIPLTIPEPEIDSQITLLNLELTRAVDVISLTTACDQMGEALGSACLAKIFGNISDLDIYISIYKTITSGNDVVILGYPGTTYTAADGKIDLSKFTLKRYDGELGNNHQSDTYYVLTPITPPSNN